MATSLENINKYNQTFISDDKNIALSNALSNSKLNEACVNRCAKDSINYKFTHVVNEQSKVVDQKMTGTCWIYAGCNKLRDLSVMKYGFGDDFELSQQYLFFYDKFEKSNNFLTMTRETSKLPEDDRLVEFFFKEPIQDGGQWAMFSNLVKKYGVIPKESFKENFNITNSYVTNNLLITKLREYGVILRTMERENVIKYMIDEQQQDMMNNIYEFLSISFGYPPLPDKTFKWETFVYTDKDRKNKSKLVLDDLTPREFFSKYINIIFDDYVSLTNDERRNHEFNVNYVVKNLNNMPNGEKIKYLNLPIEELEKYTRMEIVDGKSVWFGCNVAKYANNQLNTLNDKIYQYDKVFGIGFDGLKKGDRMTYGGETMNHAMLISGLDIDGKENINKWRVTNSWGQNGMNNGIYEMSPNWFKSHVYQVVVDKKNLSKEHLNMYENGRVEYLNPWDPMGNLAFV